MRFHLDESRTIGLDSAAKIISTPQCPPNCGNWEIGEKCSIEDSNSFNQTACSTCTPPVLCKFTKYTKKFGLVSWMQWFNLFGFYWAMNFVTSYGEMILAGIFAKWYWTKHKSEIPCSTGCTAIYNATVYHLGTIAFGSLIIAIIKVKIGYQSMNWYNWIMFLITLILLEPDTS